MHISPAIQDTLTVNVGGRGANPQISAYGLRRSEIFGKGTELVGHPADEFLEAWIVPHTLQTRFDLHVRSPFRVVIERPG
jgi:hypothetical protein